MPISDSGKLTLAPIQENSQQTDQKHESRAPAPAHERAEPKPAQDARARTQRGEASQIELAVLAAIYQNPKVCLPVFTERGRPEFIVNPVYRSFLVAAQTYFEEHHDLEPNAFLQSLIDTGQLPALGGPGFIAELITTNSPPEAFAYHLDILRDKYVAREISAASELLAAKITRLTDEELWAAVSEHERTIGELRGLSAETLDGVESFAYQDLMDFDARNDPTVLLGTNRWLGKGYTCLWAGGSGYGKSSLEMQAAHYWATGTPLFGIKPVRPLKSLIIQAENDLGDTGEQLQGVVAGIRASGDIELNGEMETMVVVVRLVGCSGEKFLSTVKTLLKIHKPDLLWIDPLFAFAGCDLLATQEISYFIRDQLIPIAINNAVCIHVIHHIGKPARDNDQKKNWSSFDYQFLGFGSSEIQNSFRAVNVLIPVSAHEGVFRLILSKRGERAGAKDFEGNPTTSLYLSHAKQGDGILWSQVEKPEEPAKKKAQARNTEAQFQEQFTLEHVLEEMSIVHGVGATALQKLLKDETRMSGSTFYRLWAELKTKGRIKVDSDRKWYIKPASE